MLNNSFYTLKTIPDKISVINTENPVEFSVIISLNPNHKIFDGHFPEQPIVPGVTYIQMIREIMETVLNRSLRLKEASNIKFLSIINPNLNTDLNFSYSLIKKDDNSIKSRVTIASDQGIVIKFDGIFTS